MEAAIQPSMKSIRSLLVLFPFLASLALAADSLPIFRGLISAGKASKFALVDPTSGNTSWVSVGGKFGDWTIADFDAKAGTLALKNGTKKATISLANSAGAADEPTASDEKSTLAQANDVLKKMNFDQMLAKTLEQQKKSSMDMVGQMMSQILPPGTMSADDLAAMSAMQKQMMDLITSAMNPADMHNDIAQAYADTFTPDELDGLGAFYSTPTGQALSDKTPALQAKIQAAMTPRIMAVMPQVQQAMQGFVQQQAAKKAAAAAPAAPAPAQ
jgi:hypothetical protein